MRQSPQLRQEPRLEQELELTIGLRLQDPFSYARELFENSQKVNVPIRLGNYTILMRAAIVGEAELDRMFEKERFAGIIARFDERYLFFNREIKVPEDARRMMPQFMAFHCLAAIRMPDFGDENGALRQYQAIALELAYARTMLPAKGYSAYEPWRQSVERTDFFGRDDWREIAQRTHARFRDFVEPMHRNAHHAKFAVMVHGETFRLTPRGTAIGQNGEIEVHRKIRHSKGGRI